VEPTANLCPHCNRLQVPPANPDTLLEESEAENKIPVFKEVAAPTAEEADLVVGPPVDPTLIPAPPIVVPPAVDAAELESRRKIREQEEALAQAQREL